MADQFGLTPRHLQILKDVFQKFSTEWDAVAVFGSRAQGNFRPNSDLDLVVYGPISEATCARLDTLFQDSSLPFSVDIKSYEQIGHLPLKEHIDNVAVQLFPQEQKAATPRATP